MAAKKPLTTEDRSRAIRIALQGIAAGVDFADLARQLEVLHPKNDTFPGEVFLELAADALGEGGISRDQPVDYEGIRERYLPERQFRGRTEHHRSHYALCAGAMIRAGVTPDLLGEVGWWDTNDLWVWSLYALLYLRTRGRRANGRACGGDLPATRGPPRGRTRQRVRLTDRAQGASKGAQRAEPLYSGDALDLGGGCWRPCQRFVNASRTHDRLPAPFRADVVCSRNGV